VDCDHGAIQVSDRGGNIANAFPATTQFCNAPKIDFLLKAVKQANFRTKHIFNLLFENSKAEALSLRAVITLLLSRRAHLLLDSRAPIKHHPE
jgi:hypothetical protein